MPTEPEIVDKCEPLPCFKRNNYFYGKLLTVSDFQVEQQYFVNKLRLINRLIHGAGVVCGLKVLIKGAEAPDLNEGSVRITEGVALDFCGREIVVPEPVDVDVAAGVKQAYPEFKEFYIWIKYDSCGEEKVPKVLEASSCQEECCYSRIKETYKIDVDVEKNVPKPWGTSEGDVCAKWDEFVKDPKNYEFFLKNCAECLEEGVIVLAKITVSAKEDGSIFVGAVDNAVFTGTERRRFVYSNERLYNLIECLRKRIEDLKKKESLPKITRINWRHDESYTSKELAELLKNECFRITFDRAMKQTTINTNTLSLTLEETYHDSERVRISKEEIPIEIEYPEKNEVKFWPNLEPSNSRAAVAAVASTASILKRRLIIQLKGDFVCSDEKESKCLDGNHLKGERSTGNDCEGGLFESWLTVAPEGKKVVTTAYFYASPKSVGLGQSTQIVVFVTPKPPKPSDVFHNFHVKITRPDRTTEKKDWLESNPDGSQSFFYTFAANGDYTIDFNYDGETFESTGDCYTPCSLSPNAKLTVQDELAPLPAVGLYVTPAMIVAIATEGTSESKLLEEMEKAEIRSVEDLAELTPAEIEAKLGVSERIAEELNASGKSVKELSKIEGIDKNMVRGLMATGTTSAKVLAETKPEEIKKVLGITTNQAKTLRKNAARAG
jgi:hypothetical protein